MVCNFHGMFGHADNINYRLLKRRFKKENVYSPQCDYHLENLSDTLNKVITKMKTFDTIDLVVGNSFGGFIAMYVATTFNAPLIVVNPCVRPDISLVPIVPSYSEKNSIEFFRTLEIVRHNPNLITNSCIILGDHDDIIDPVYTYEFFGPDADIQVVKGGHQLSSETYRKAFHIAIIKLLHRGEINETNN